MIGKVQVLKSEKPKEVSPREWAWLCLYDCVKDYVKYEDFGNDKLQMTINLADEPFKTSDD